jgi:hypothetical protein
VEKRGMIFGAWRPARRAAVIVALTLIAGLLATGSVALAGKPGTATATLTNVVLDGCNSLEYGQLIRGRQQRLGAIQAGACDAVSLRDRKATYDLTDGLVLYLLDRTCGRVYFSDGTGDANHARISVSTEQDQVDIADAGGGCATAITENVPDQGAGNLRLFVSPPDALAGAGAQPTPSPTPEPSPTPTPEPSPTPTPTPEPSPTPTPEPSPTPTPTPPDLAQLLLDYQDACRGTTLSGWAPVDWTCFGPKPAGNWFDSQPLLALINALTPICASAGGSMNMTFTSNDFIELECRFST